MKLRWGIVCTGLISNDFMMALKCLPEKDHEAVAVAARQISDAQSFAKNYQIKRAYGSYEELADDPNIDVVYVGIINTLHLKISKLMLEHGKNVLCEKPLAMNLREAIEITDLAKKKNLYLMEAIWSRCFPLYKKLAELITSNYIGDIKFVNCNFGVNMNRQLKRDLGNSCLMDIGIYAVQIVTLAFNHEKPAKIAAVGTLNDDDTDTAFSVSMVFPNGGQASIAGSVDVEYPCDAIIYGTKGTIKLHNPFWCAFEMTVNGEKFEIPIPHDDIATRLPHSAGLQYEAEEVRQNIMKGDKECPWMTHTHSKVIAAIMDEIRSQIGVHFSADDNQ